MESYRIDLTGKDILAIFAKEPVAGKVKTRLCPPLSPDQAVSLYRVFIEETIASLKGGPSALVLFYSGCKDFFIQTFPAIPLIPQSGGDLGARLDIAFRTLFDAGCRRTVIIGSDTPDLPPSIVAEAFAALEDHDAVVSPAIDGGYVLIGQRTHNPELFRDIPWSTENVLSATRKKASAADIRLAVTSGWEDVDDLPSLLRLIDRAPDTMSVRLSKTFLDVSRIPLRGSLSTLAGPQT